MNTATPPLVQSDVWRWRFAHVELDEAALELRVAGVLVEMEPKPMEFLMCLLRHSGEVVTKDELLEALWTGRVVTESVLTSCVAKLRFALNDHAHKLIRTVHGYGYRLVAEVSRETRAGRQPLAETRLKEGDAPPLRPQWRLVQALGGGRGETWLVRHAKTGEQRVLKFALDARQLAQLKREVTVQRLLKAILGERDDLVRMLDWNLESPPCFIEFEHCAGGDLSQWLARQGGAAAVPLAVRLDVVAKCAHALAAVHSAGVLHKDLKPANILVDGDGARPLVRLADLGSGGILDAERLNLLNITSLGFTSCTPPESGGSGTWSYMAPEVAAGQAPTLRSDVFSLGVLLYQLAIGDLHRLLAPGWERDIEDELLRDDVAACCDIDPLKRLADPAALSRRLATLEQRRNELARRRAATAQAIALADAVARGRVRRRWLTALAAVACTAFAVTLSLYIQVQSARAQAEEQAAAARSVNDYLVRDLLAAANPLNPLPAMPAGSRHEAGQVPVRELLDRAAAHAGQRFADQPALEAAVRRSLGEAYLGMAAYREAARQFEIAFDRLPDVPEPAAVQRIAALERAAHALREADELAGAQAALDKAMGLIARARGLVDGAALERVRLQTRSTQAWLLYKTGAYAEAIEIMKSERPALVDAFGEFSDESATAYTRLANTQLLSGDARQAEESARRALTVRRRVHGDGHPLMIEAHSTLADILRLEGHAQEAEKESRKALEMSRGLLGDDHTSTLIAQGSLATLLQDAKRYDEAIALFEDAARRSAATYGEKTYEATVLVNNLGLAYADAGRTREAVEALERSLANGRALLGADHPDVISREHNLADVMADDGRWDEALALERGALSRARAAWGDEHAYVGLMLRTMGRILAHKRQREEAKSALMESKRILIAQLGPDHAQVRKVEQLLAAIGR